jgi:hypothetical protein
VHIRKQEWTIVACLNAVIWQAVTGQLATCQNQRCSNHVSTAGTVDN